MQRDAAHPDFHCLDCDSVAHDSCFDEGHRRCEATPPEVDERELADERAYAAWKGDR